MSDRGSRPKDPRPQGTRRHGRRNPAGLIAAAVTLFVVLSALSVITISSSNEPKSSASHSLPSPIAGLPSASLVPSRGGISHPSSSALQSVISTIDLVDNRTLPGTSIPAIQDSPTNIVYDSINGDLYVRGTSTAVTVVSATTDRIVTTLGVAYGGNAYSLAPTMAVDTLTGNVYTTNYNTGNLSMINGTTNQVTGNFGSGLSPISAVFDPDNGYLYVSDWILGEVTVINGGNNQILYNIPVGSEPSALLYDHASSEVFVANFNSNNVSIIDTGTHTVVKNIPTGTTSTHPQVLALDTKDNYVDVGSQTTDNISVINASTWVLVAHPYVPYDSDGLAYSPNQDELFVENGGEGNVSVFNQSEGTRIVANITTGTGPEGIAFDSINHEIYVLNSEVPNVTVINPVNNHRIANIWPTDGLDYAVAVDTTSGNIFIGSEGTYSGSIRGYQANLTVVAGTTNLPIASVPLNVFPEGLTYDSGNHEVVAADVGGQDVYRLNGTTGLTVGTAATGYAWTSAYDSVTGDLWVLNTGSDNITVLNSAYHTVTSLTPDLYPQGIAFDSANGDMYIPDEVSGEVWVYNGATEAFVKTILVKTGADLYAVVYDPHNQEVYVADQTGGNLSIINGTSQTTVGSIPTSTTTHSLAFDSTNDTIWAANSGNLTVISDATNKSVASVSATYAFGLLAFDPANNVMYDAGDFESEVTGIGASNYSVLGFLYLGENSYTSGITYDPLDHDVYVSTATADILSVIGPPLVTYSVQFRESGLVGSPSWSVTFNGVLNSSTTDAIGFSVPSGGYSFTVGSVAGYTANVTSGTVTVTTGPKVVYIAFTAVASSYAVTFIESGLPPTSPWNVTLNDVQNHSTTNSIGFLEPAGTWAFVVGTFTGYVANNTSGNVHVSTTAVTVYIGFTALSSTFPVTFIESGLNPTTPWNVSFYGGTNHSTTTSIGFRAPDGKWPFTVAKVTGYVANVTAGNVTVAGAARDIYIGFTATIPTYPVNFTETGLPHSTPWTVTLNGTLKGSSTSPITFFEPTGSYPFSVGSVAGYSASPNSGSADVAGAPYQQAIVFTAGSAPLTAQLVVLPANITLGNSATLTTTTSGGAPPFIYAYAGLPTGCVTHNSSSWSCTPTVTGSFPLVVTVTDTHGNFTHAAATLNVSSAPSNNASASANSSWLWIVVVLVVVAALVLFVVLRRRHKAPPPSPTAPPPAETPPPP
ncbi:MAG: YncE family protein [Thermoplasmata archaeon]